MADFAQIKPRAVPSPWRPTLVRAAVAVFLVAGLQMSAADTGVAQWIRAYPWLAAAAFLAWLALAHVAWDRRRWHLLARFRALLDAGRPQHPAHEP